MPEAARLGDHSKIDAGFHGGVCCPHPEQGPAIFGSTDVFINKKPAIREGDPGIYAPCCKGGMWKAKTGSATVLINGKKAHRKGDMDDHGEGNMGRMIQGSSDVLIGG